MTVITSTASISKTRDEVFGWDNLAPLAGSWRNIFFNETVGDIRWGILRGKFTFDFEEIELKFENMSPPIPHTAVILRSFVRGAAFSTSDTATFITVIQVLKKDGRWDQDSFDGWVSATAGNVSPNMDVVVLSTLGGTLVDTDIGGLLNWPIRDNVSSRSRRAGQGVTIEAAATLGFADISIQRTGAPVGDIWCEIYSQDGLGIANTLLATSNTRPASDAPASMAPLRFTFSGVEQIALTLNQKVVVVLNGDYPESSTANVGVGWNSTGYFPGTMQLDGIGVGFDDQNYPVMESFRTIPAQGDGLGFVVWFAPQFILGVDYDTPDITPILQAYIEGGEYIEGDSIGIAISKADFLFPNVTAQRAFAQFGHPTLQPIRLIVEWAERDVADASHVRSVQAQASHVMIAPAEASHVRIVSGQARHQRGVGADASHDQVLAAKASHVEEVASPASFAPVIQAQASHVMISPAIPAQASHVQIVNAEARHQQVATGEASHVQIINAEASQEI